MQIYRTKAEVLESQRYAEIRTRALQIYKKIQKKTKRRPYIRSKYFRGQKIFFDFFWVHLFQIHPYQRRKRLRYFAAAIELLRHTRHDPTSKENPNVPHELLHRFAGATKEAERFYVQVKENLKNDKKYFMSCFPDYYDDK